MIKTNQIQNIPETVTIDVEDIFTKVGGTMTGTLEVPKLLNNGKYTNVDEISTLGGKAQKWSEIPRQTSDVVFQNTLNTPAVYKVQHIGISSDTTKEPYIYAHVGETADILHRVDVVNSYYQEYPSFTVTFIVPSGHYYKVKYLAQTNAADEIKYYRLGN